MQVKSLVNRKSLTGVGVLKKDFIRECFAPRLIMFQGLCHFPCFQCDLNNLSS